MNENIIYKIGLFYIYCNASTGFNTITNKTGLEKLLKITIINPEFIPEL